MKSLFFASFLFLIAEFSFAKEEIKYTISSDSQINTVKGDLKANGNVLIKRKLVGISLKITTITLNDYISLGL